MANTKFKVRNGLYSQNVTFVDSVDVPTVSMTMEMDLTDQLNFTTGAGTILSINNSLSSDAVSITGGISASEFVVPTKTSADFLRGDGSASALASSEITAFEANLSIAESQIVFTSDFVTEAPNDGQKYVRGSENWVEFLETNIEISETSPTTPIVGQLWYDSGEGTPYIYYNDGDSSQWIEMNGTPSVLETGIKTGKAIVLSLLFG